MSLMSFCSSYLEANGFEFVDMGNYQLPTSTDKEALLSPCINVSCVYDDVTKENDPDTVFLRVNTANNESKPIVVYGKREAELILRTMESIVRVIHSEILESKDKE